MYDKRLNLSKLTFWVRSKNISLDIYGVNIGVFLKQPLKNCNSER